MPSRSRLSRALFSVVNSRSEIWSVSTRLISSGMRAVEAAQARLDVDHGHALLDRDQRAGQRGIHVAHHQHRGRPLPVEHRLEAAHDLGGLHRVRGRAHLEVDVRVGYAQRLEELAVHLRVVVLPGVHEPHRQRRTGAPASPG